MGGDVGTYRPYVDGQCSNLVKISKHKAYYRRIFLPMTHPSYLLQEIQQEAHVDVFSSGDGQFPELKEKGRNLVDEREKCVCLSRCTKSSYIQKLLYTGSDSTTKSGHRSYP